MGTKFNEHMICCCYVSRKWWWGSIHVFDSPIKFLNYLDKEGSIDIVKFAGDGNLYIFGEEEVKSVALVKGK